MPSFPLSNRIVWIDYVKAFSIVAVVLFHTNIPYLKSLAYILCLPAFFFISGLFIVRLVSILIFLKKRCIRILIPYVIFGILSWLAWLLIGRKYGYDHEDTIDWWVPLLGLISGKTEWIIQNRPLWFLCCLVSLDWLYWIVNHIRSKIWMWIVILCIACIGCCAGYYHLFGHWRLNTSMIVLPLYALGAENKELIIRKAKTCSYISLIATMILAILVIIVGYFYNSDFDLSLADIGNPFLFYSTSLAVILLWATISILCDRLFGRLRILSYIGQNTLLILCAHIPVFGMIKGIALLCHVSLDFFETAGGCLCLWLGTFIILLPAAYFINKYCPWILGKQKTIP